MYGNSLHLSQAPMLVAMLGCYVVVVVGKDPPGMPCSGDPATMMVAAYLRKGNAERRVRRLAEQGIQADIQLMEGSIDELRDLCRKRTVKVESRCCYSRGRHANG